jgi:hypothetical protein
LRSIAPGTRTGIGPSGRLTTFARTQKLAIPLALAVAALVGAGCGATKHSTPSSRAAAIGITGRPIGNLSTPGTPKGEQVVHIEVVAKVARPRAALALVPIYIDGKGPLPFALDTGASRSLIAEPLARLLHLTTRGPTGLVAGVTGATRGVNVQISSWRAGSVPLPAATIAAIPAGGSRQTNTRRRHLRGPIGLLGSDVLSRYGKIAVDYDKGLLILDPPVK